MWRRFNFDDRHQGVIEYWDFLQTELRRRFGLSMSLLEAAREVVFSPPSRMSAFAGWDSPERIVTNAYSLYRHWAPERAPGRAPFGKMNLMRQQAGRAFELPGATPRALRRHAGIRPRHGHPPARARFHLGRHPA